MKKLTFGSCSRGEFEVTSVASSGSWLPQRDARGVERRRQVAQEYLGGLDRDVPLRLNLGCGSRKMSGTLNVDKTIRVSPDILWNIEDFPWPFETSSVSEIWMAHVLEHVGQKSDVFLRIMQELYRISRDGTRIHIVVPHHGHLNFITDPTHVRPITFDLLEMFSRDKNLLSRSEGKSDTPFALLYDVDFTSSNQGVVMDRGIVGMAIQRGILSLEEANNVTFVYELSKLYGNFVKQISVDLTAHKR